MSGCIDLKVARVGNAIDISVSAEGMQSEAEQVVALFQYDAKALPHISASVSRMGVTIDFAAGIICDVPQDRYLIVDEGIIWLVPENGYTADVSVKSNVRWTIN
jgi:hypothetical protein